MARICQLSELQVQEELGQVLERFSGRHHALEAYFLRRFEQVKDLLGEEAALSTNGKLLIGAYFTQEYALEGAALFNPSLIWHPDQQGVPENARRFILSLRATGEGHISSIVFRSGIVDSTGNIVLDSPSPFISGPEALAYPTYDHTLFQRKLEELNHSNPQLETTLSSLKERFTMDELKAVIQQDQRDNPESSIFLDSLLALARANYEVTFLPEHPLSERVLFPTSPTEINGMEDARFVAFQEEDGQIIYYATYTAYNGKTIMPQLLETRDFLTFRMSTLNGSEARNKGLALFPRRIQGHYAMLARQDHENVSLMYSDYLHFWETQQILLQPAFPWEYVQLGNCGSPLETDAGWLVLTHGVGPMRQYFIGAILLDKDDPSRVIGRLPHPLVAPESDEWAGYVPNVVYSCGGEIFHNWLVLPYAVADSRCNIAVFPLNTILRNMQPYT